MAATIGVAILALLGFWMLGGVVARWGGALLVAAGAVGLATTGDGDGLVLVVAGAALWLIGHLHFWLRRDAFKSALAERICLAAAGAWRRGQERGAALLRQGDLRVLRDGARTPDDDECKEEANEHRD